MTRLILAADAIAADWIVAALRTFGGSVLSLVPGGFPAYVRVFHPAYRFDPESPQPWETRTPVRWTEIAAANSTRAHPGMQLTSLTGFYRFLNNAQPGVYDHPPSEGSLPLEIGEPLAMVLARHTSTPDRCWFAIWNGFGATRDDIRQAPTFLVPAREHFLLSGPIEAATETAIAQGRHQSPNIWWPEDHAWCVATEIDLNTTYIGCSEDCQDDMLAVPELEVLTIDPATGIDWNSDSLNPKPQLTSPDA